MDKAEKETIININQADIDHGYFCFYTSVESEYKKLLKKVGGKGHLKFVETYLAPGGAVTGWSCHVPSKYLNKATWTIRVPRQISEEQKARLIAAGMNSRLRSKKQHLAPGGDT